MTPRIASGAPGSRRSRDEERLRRAFSPRRKNGGSSTFVLGVAAVLAAVALAALSLATSPAAGATAALTTDTLTFASVADARVEEANPAVNFGTWRRLVSDGGAGARIESVLRFELTGISGTVQSAKLRLHVVGDATMDGPAVYPTGDDWTETDVTWETRPQATGAAVADMRVVAVGTWVELDVTALVSGDGSVSVLLKQSGTDGVHFYSREGTYKPELVVTTAKDPVVMAAGDIACKPGSIVTATKCRHEYTSDLLLSEPDLTTVLTLGDNQYDDGLYSEFTGTGAYDATWGRVKSITKPSPGNHEYHIAGASGYFDYFGAAAGERGKGYYSFDLGSWHLIALNSEISVAAGSEQESWLRNDLAATTERCILAYWHKPRFSSGYHGGSSSVAPLWDALYAADADVVLNGHDHSYERFAPQNPSGQADASGIRQFVVGTGGASHSSFTTVRANSEVRDETTFGVVKLTLRPSSYEWQFVPEAGGTFTDSGSAPCHDSPPAASLTVTPSSGVAPLAVTADASASTDTDGTPIESYTFDFGDGSPAVGPQREAAATHMYTAAGTYTVTVTVTDTARLSSTATAQVVVAPNVNLVRNPGFETDTSGWNTGSGTSSTLTSVSGGRSGDRAAKLTNTGETAGACALNDSPNSVTTTLAGTYTGSLWVRADAAGATLKLRLREYSGTTLVGGATAQVTLTTLWQQVTVTYAPASPGSSTLDYNAYVIGAAPGTCFYADDAAIYLHDPAALAS